MPEEHVSFMDLLYCAGIEEVMASFFVLYFSYFFSYLFLSFFFFFLLRMGVR